MKEQGVEGGGVCKCEKVRKVVDSKIPHLLAKEKTMKAPTQVKLKAEALPENSPPFSHHRQAEKN